MATTARTIGRWLEQIASACQGETGHHAATLDGVQLMVFCDEQHDRIRALAPVADADALGRAELALLLEANFDRALDAKYTIWHGAVVALFVHPLGSLGRADFESGLRQLVALKHNFGTSFASTGLAFGGPDPERVGPGAAASPTRAAGKKPAKPN